MQGMEANTSEGDEIVYSEREDEPSRSSVASFLKTSGCLKVRGKAPIGLSPATHTAGKNGNASYNVLNFNDELMVLHLTAKLLSCGKAEPLVERLPLGTVGYFYVDIDMPKGLRGVVPPSDLEALSTFAYDTISVLHPNAKVALIAQKTLRGSCDLIPDSHGMHVHFPSLAVQKHTGVHLTEYINAEYVRSPPAGMSEQFMKHFADNPTQSPFDLMPFKTRSLIRIIGVEKERPSPGAPPADVYRWTRTNLGDGWSDRKLVLEFPEFEEIAACSVRIHTTIGPEGKVETRKEHADPLELKEWPNGFLPTYFGSKTTAGKRVGQRSASSSEAREASSADLRLFAALGKLFPAAKEMKLREVKLYPSVGFGATLKVIVWPGSAANLCPTKKASHASSCVTFSVNLNTGVCSQGCWSLKPPCKGIWSELGKIATSAYSSYTKAEVECGANLVDFTFAGDEEESTLTSDDDMSPVASPRTKKKRRMKTAPDLDAMPMDVEDVNESSDSDNEDEQGGGRDGRGADADDEFDKIFHLTRSEMQQTNDAVGVGIDLSDENCPDGLRNLIASNYQESIKDTVGQLVLEQTATAWHRGLAIPEYQTLMDINRYCPINGYTKFQERKQYQIPLNPDCLTTPRKEGDIVDRILASLPQHRTVFPTVQDILKDPTYAGEDASAYARFLVEVTGMLVNTVGSLPLISSRDDEIIDFDVPSTYNRPDRIFNDHRFPVHVLAPAEIVETVTSAALRYYHKHGRQPNLAARSLACAFLINRSCTKIGGNAPGWAVIASVGDAVRPLQESALIRERVVDENGKVQPRMVMPAWGKETIEARRGAETAVMGKKTDTEMREYFSGYSVPDLRLDHTTGRRRMGQCIFAEDYISMYKTYCKNLNASANSHLLPSGTKDPRNPESGVFLFRVARTRDGASNLRLSSAPKTESLTNPGAEMCSHDADDKDEVEVIEPANVTSLFSVLQEYSSRRLDLEAYTPAFVGKISQQASQREFNTWSGPAFAPTSASVLRWAGREDEVFEKVDMWVHHCLEVLCSGDEIDHSFVTRWAASLIRNPSVRRPVAIIVSGQKGCGKDIYFDTLRDLVGSNNSRALGDLKILAADFNSLAGSVVLIAFQEAKVDSAKIHDVLKMFITENTQKITRKYHEPSICSNFASLVLTSNHKNVVPPESDQRRFKQLSASSTQTGKKNYFTQLGRCDLSALAYYLYFMVDISGFQSSDLPMTHNQRETLYNARTPVAHYIHDVLDTDCLNVLRAPNRTLHIRGKMVRVPYEAEPGKPRGVTCISVDELFSNFRNWWDYLGKTAREGMPMVRDADEVLQSEFEVMLRHTLTLFKGARKNNVNRDHGGWIGRASNNRTMVMFSHDLSHVRKIYICKHPELPSQVEEGELDETKGDDDADSDDGDSDGDMVLTLDRFPIAQLIPWTAEELGDELDTEAKEDSFGGPSNPNSSSGPKRCSSDSVYTCSSPTKKTKTASPSKVTCVT